MSAPKNNRKTPGPKGERIYKHTEELRQKVLRILQQNVNRPVEDLQQLTGADKSQLNVCKEWLRLRGHNILSLTKGYVLISDTLPTFPEMPERGPLTCSVDGDSLTTSNGRDSITAPFDEWWQALLKLGVVHTVTEIAIPKTAAVPEKLVTETRRQLQRQTVRSGRPAPTIPADRTPLLKVFQECQEQGRPLYRTGKQGVYARRAELPEEFRGIGRDRLERLITEMIDTGILFMPKKGAVSKPTGRPTYEVNPSGSLSLFQSASALQQP